VANRQWQVQEAKGRFSEVIAEAQQSGPQSITKHGREVAVLMSSADFERLSDRPTSSLVDFLASIPFDELQIPERDRADVGRDVSL
jgi:prevent-host-death family protein